MQFPNIDPVFFRLGRLEFRWYGLMYILGFMAGYFIVLGGVKRKKLALSKDDVADLIFVLALGVILGGRLGYVLFYNFAYYAAHPLHILFINEGGMSFHGGLLGITLAGLYFARKKKLRFFLLADLCTLAVPIGLGLGRIGNFLNGELYGRVTDLPWGMVFPGGGVLPRHPSQLYEAFLEGPLLFALLWLIRRREFPVGVLFGSCIALYGVFRFLVEFFREPDPQLGYVLGSFSMGQLLSLPMVLVGGVLVWFAWRRKLVQ